MLTATASAQLPAKYGATLSAAVEKELNRYWDLNVENETRFSTPPLGFERNITDAGLDYSLLDRKIKLGAYYAFLYLYNDNHRFEARHRYYFNISYRKNIEPWSFSWRGRWQITHRDETRGEYKINPKQILKNKIQIEYALWGKPWKPFISCDFYTDINNPAGKNLSRIRWQGGALWRLNRTDYLEFFARYDHYTDRREPAAFSLGTALKFRSLRR